MNYPQLDSEDSSNVDCFGELPPSCICLYIYIYIIVYIVYHLGSGYRHWYVMPVISIVQCCICFRHFNIPLPTMLYLPARGQYIAVFLRIMENVSKQELCSIMSNCVVGPVQGGSLCFSWNNLGTGRTSWRERTGRRCDQTLVRGEWYTNIYIYIYMYTHFFPVFKVP